MKESTQETLQQKAGHEGMCNDVYTTPLDLYTEAGISE